MLYYNLNKDADKMNKSLNQVIKTFHDWAALNLNIATFEFKPITHATAKNYVYPLMHTSIGNVSFASGEMQIAMDIYILDKMLSDESNYQDVLSDTLKIMNDFYTTFQDNEEAYGFYFAYEATAEPIAFDFDDVIGGFKMPITVQVKNRRDEASVPYDE
jgi:hypothetical protein